MLNRIVNRINSLPESFGATSHLLLMAVFIMSLCTLTAFHQPGASASSPTPTRAFGSVPREVLAPEIFDAATTPLLPGASFQFRATAYCLNGVTASGSLVAQGIVAADPKVLPLGTWIHVEAPGYEGVYRVMDTGLKIRGSRIDIYMPSKEMALRFGIQNATVTILSSNLVNETYSPLAYSLGSDWRRTQHLSD
jgi:3D (Asp-Asp-Asp) domain-containing protein